MMSGRKVVFWFAGSMGILAVLGLGIVIWIRSMPVAQKDQRILSYQLMFAYQKYRFDSKAWPVNVHDAAEGFRGENDELLANVEKAEKEWGMTARVENPDSKEPELIVEFEKPAHFERKHVLTRDGRSGKVSANY